MVTIRTPVRYSSDWLELPRGVKPSRSTYVFCCGLSIISLITSIVMFSLYAAYAPSKHLCRATIHLEDDGRCVETIYFGDLEARREVHPQFKCTHRTNDHELCYVESDGSLAFGPKPETGLIGVFFAVTILSFFLSLCSCLTAARNSHATKKTSKEPLLLDADATQ